MSEVTTQLDERIANSARADAWPRFIAAFSALLDTHPNEARVRSEGGALLAELVRDDDWLPPSHAAPGTQRYRQYPLHIDAAGRFSVVSFVWGPGQSTPIHDHTVWGLIGMLRGQEVSQPYEVDPGGRAVPAGDPVVLRPGQVEAVSPRLGDIHRVHNAFDDRVSISIHVYGANIGAVRRWVYPAEGGRKPFVSGYSNAWVPNLWDRSKDTPAP